MMDQTTVPGVVQQGEKLQGDGWPCLGKYSMLTQSFKLQCSALQKGMHNTVHVHAGTCSSCKAIDIHAEYILILLSLQRHPLAFASL